MYSVECNLGHYHSLSKYILRSKIIPSHYIQHSILTNSFRYFLCNTANAGTGCFVSDQLNILPITPKEYFLRNTQNLKKIFLMVLTNQLIYLVNVKTMRMIFFKLYIHASQKVWTLTNVVLGMEFYCKYFATHWLDWP